MPLRTVYTPIISLESQLAIAYLLPSRQDVSAISRCQTATLVGICITIDFYFVPVTFLSGITGRTIVQCETDSIQNGGFATTRRPYDTEDGAFAQHAFFEVDDFALLPIQGSEIEYFEFLKFHIQSVVSFLIPSNNS